MSFELGDLAERFGLQLVGDGVCTVSGVCALHPGVAGQLSFCADSRRLPGISESASAAVIVPEAPAASGCNLLIAENPALAFARIAALFDDAYDFKPGVDSTATVAEGVELSAGVHVGAHAVLEAGVVVGENCFVGPQCLVRAGACLGEACRLEARVYIGPRCRLSQHVHVLPGAVIGGRGFGNVPGDQGWEEIPQLGAVSIGNDVEIGANTCIDRGTFENTRIEDGVRLDNLIQIAHNCVVGSGTAIAACVGIAGSTRIGARCMIGGAVGIAGHVEIADGVTVLARAGVTKSLPGPGIYAGFPAIPVRQWHHQVARGKRLGHLERRVVALEKQVKAGSEQPGGDGEIDE